MHLIYTDILQHNGQLWVSQRLILQECGVDENYLWKRARPLYKSTLRRSSIGRSGDMLPDSGAAWRWGRKDGQFYYAYNNIPDRKPAYYRGRLGSEQQLLDLWQQCRTADRAAELSATASRLVQMVNTSSDGTLYTYYSMDAPVTFAPDKARQLSIAKTWCDTLHRMATTRNYKGLAISNNSDLYAIAATVLAAEQLEGLKVSTPGALRNKIEAYPALNPQASRDYLISSKYYNNNAALVGKFPIYDEETGEILFTFDYHEAIMHAGHMNPGSPSKNNMRHSYEHCYLPAIDQLGIKPIAYSTYKWHLSKWINRLLDAKERHGRDYFRKTALTYVPGQKLQFSHSLMAGDGSGTVSYKFADVQGKLRSRKLYVILISDVASRHIAGWSPSREGYSEETPKMVEDAVRMAVQNAGKQTLFEFVSDNHGAFTSADSRHLLNLVFDRVRTIDPGNSQANPAETAFRLFKGSLKQFENFVSSSWNVGIEGQSNPDYLDPDKLPTYQEALVQMEQIIKAWNNAELPDDTTCSQRFEQNKHPDCKPMDGRVLRWLYGNHTKSDVSLYRQFIKVSKTNGYYQRDTRLFEIPIGAIAELSNVNGRYGAEVKIVWDDEMADLYTLNGEYIVSCLAAKGASQSHAEADADSGNILGHHLKRKQQMEDMADAHAAKINEAFAAMQREIPYAQDMALGGSKESYNNEMNAQEEAEKLRRERINRKFEKMKKNNPGHTTDAAGD